MIDLDFSTYVLDRTRDFTGREWVFKAINDWLADPDGSRFFFLKGEPGSGKTTISARLRQFSQGLPPPNGLSHLTQGFLSAIHFCSARDTTWIDPLLFAGSLATQLANRYPAYLKLLEDLHQEKQIEINVKQIVQEVINGQVIGVIINVSGPSPESAFNRVVREPLKALLGSGVNEQVVILVDALDEALSYSGTPTIVSLLAKTDQLPPQVRFLLTTRQEERVENQFLGVKELSLAIPGDQSNQDDIRRYVEGRLQNDLQLAEKVAQVETTQVTDLVELVPLKAEGNFLYVRFLLDAMAKGLRPLTELEGLPTGLDWLYFDSLRRVVELGKRDWFHEYCPLMGVLSVAQEGLTLAQIQAFTKQSESSSKEYRRNLEQFIEEVKPQGEEATRYRLYHQSVMDFLQSKIIAMKEKGGERALENTFYLPADEWHKHMANVCEQDNLSIIWEDIKRNPVEQSRREYARRYHITHLYLAQEWQKIFEVLDTIQYGQSKIRNDPSTNSYTLDLDLGRQATTWRGWTLDEGIALLPRLWQYTLLRCSLASRVDQYPGEAFQLMLLLGEEAKAIGFAELTTMPEQKAVRLLVIARYLARQARREADGTRMFLRVQEVISFISDERQRAETLIALATSLAQTGRLEEAQRVWAEAERVAASISEGWQRAKTLTALATALIQQQQWAEAERISTSISDEGEQAKAMAALATALAQAGREEQAQQVLAEVERMCTSISSEWQRLEVLSALATALAQAGREEQARQVLAEVERMCTSISEEWLKEIAFKSLATALIQQQQWAEAERVAASISEGWQRESTLVELATALIQAGRLEQAQRVLAEAEWVRTSIPLHFYEMLGVRILIAQAIALIQAGQQEQAQRVWAEAERVRISFPDKWEGARKLIALATALAKAGQQEQAQRVWAEAERVAASISEGWQKALVLKELAFALAWQQQWTEAERVGTSLSNERDKAESLAALANDLARHQQWTEARRVSASIPDEWLKAEALIAQATALTQAGQQEEAQRVLAEAEQVSASILHTQQRVDALRSLAIALAQAGRQEEAQRVLVEVEREAVSILDTQQRAVALSELAIALAQQQQWAEAERVAASSNFAAGQKARAMIALAIALAQAGRQEEAQRVLVEVEQEAVSILDTQQRADVLRALAIALAQQQQWAEAKRVAASISLRGQRAEALIALATALAQAGQQEEAQRILAEAERVSASISLHEDRRAEALRDLTIALAQQQRWAEAEQVSTSIPDGWQRAEALTALAAIPAVNGEFERLLGLVHRFWQGVEQRSEAVNYLPLAYGFLPRYPELGTAFSDAFTWVDTFLHT